MKIKLATDEIIKHKADCLIIAIPRSGGKLTGALAKLDHACGKALSEVLKHKDLLKTTNRHLIVLQRSGYKSMLVLLRDKEEVTSVDLQAALRGALAQAVELQAKSVVVHLESVVASAGAWAVRQAAQACGSAGYDFKLGLGAVKPTALQVTLLADAKAAQPAAAKRALRIGAAIAEGVRLAKHLAEQPPNLLYPESLAKIVTKTARAAGLRTKVLDHNALKKLRMGGLLAVGQGSVRPPRLIVLQHDGGRKGSAPIVLVGKGITFDTGGNSLKPSAAMVDMKFDMCGAAGVVGTLLACARMKLPLNVAAVVPSAENMVNGNALRPDDIIRMMDGQQVEVLNTDAEGRLILADALTYAQEFLKPAVIVDAATLTGACLVALGQHRSGLCANSDKLADELHIAGDDCADPCWRLPLDDAYDRLLKSELADLANIGGGRNAGTITAACFLQRFVKVKQWAHLDIAGSAWQGRRASGRPVPLLTTWLAARAGWLKD